MQPLIMLVFVFVDYYYTLILNISGYIKVVAGLDSASFNYVIHCNVIHLYT